MDIGPSDQRRHSADDKRASCTRVGAPPKERELFSVYVRGSLLATGRFVSTMKGSTLMFGAQQQANSSALCEELGREVSREQ